MDSWSIFNLLSGLLPLILAAPLLAAAAEPPAQPARDAAVENSIGMKLVVIPAGSFMMGSPEDERGRNADEQPHRVEITSGFYLGAYEVTQRQYELVMEENPSQFASTGGFAERVANQETASHPVDSVSWHEAVRFCERLSQLPAEQAAGRSYRLPTEAEWEYACRAGSDTIWHFGIELDRLRNYAWYRDPPWQQRTYPVGQKLPNAFGLYDIYGNVWEWCSDWYAADYYSHSPAANPQGPEQGETKVIRGGSWYSIAASCRNAARESDPPTVVDPDTGFRVVMQRLPAAHTDIQHTDD